MGLRALSDGKKKVTILTTEPADPAAPTQAELAAGIDVSCDVLASDFTFGAVASDTVQEKALCTENNANALGPSNFEAGFTFFRHYDDATKAPDESGDDAGFQAVKVKETTVWAYARETAKKSTEDWAAEDEIYFGAEMVSDTPQRQAVGGYIKDRVDFQVQVGYPFIAVAAGV